MVLGRVVKKEDACLILTFLDESEIGVTKKITRRFRHRPKQMDRLSEVGLKPFFKSALYPFQYCVPELMQEQTVDLNDNRLRHPLTLDDPFRHLTQIGSEIQRESKHSFSFRTARPFPDYFFGLRRVENLGPRKPRNEVIEVPEKVYGSPALHYLRVDEIQA
jgi:hypothetical protein